MRIIFPLIASLSLISMSCGEGDDSRQLPPQAVRVVQARRGDVVQGRSYLAEVVSHGTVQVMARVQGTVASLPVAVGQAAQGEEVLVRLAAPDVMARLNRVHADRQRAEAERDFVCGRLETDRLLQQAGDMAPDQLDVSEKNCAAARLAASAARSAEEEVSAVSARSLERAPYTGFVLEHLTEPGQTVMPGMPLVLFGTEERELLLRVPATDLADGLGRGTAALFDGGQGVVSSVGGWAKGPGQLVELRVQVEDQQALPPVGATTSVKLVQDAREGASSVPMDALGHDEAGSYLLLVQGDRAQRTAVIPGPRDAGWVAVDPALPLDSLVVVGQVGAVDTERQVLAVQVES